MTSTDVFRAYLERFTGGDVEGAAELLADDFTFRGPILQADSQGRVPCWLDACRGRGTRRQDPPCVGRRR